MSGECFLPGREWAAGSCPPLFEYSLETCYFCEVDGELCQSASVPCSVFFFFCKNVCRKLRRVVKVRSEIMCLEPFPQFEVFFILWLIPAPECRACQSHFVPLFSLCHPGHGSGGHREGPCSDVHSGPWYVAGGKPRQRCTVHPGICFPFSFLPATLPAFHSSGFTSVLVQNTHVCRPPRTRCPARSPERRHVVDRQQVATWKGKSKFMVKTAGLAR